MRRCSAVRSWICSGRPGLISGRCLMAVSGLSIGSSTCSVRSARLPCFIDDRSFGRHRSSSCLGYPKDDGSVRGYMLDSGSPRRSSDRRGSCAASIARTLHRCTRRAPLVTGDVRAQRNVPNSDGTLTRMVPYRSGIGFPRIASIRKIWSKVYIRSVITNGNRITLSHPDPLPFLPPLPDRSCRRAASRSPRRPSSPGI